MSRIALLTAVAAIAIAAPATAAQVVASLPDFNGPQNSGGFPIDLGVVGTFNFALPGNAMITGATIGGTYGTAVFSTSTAGFDIDIDGAVVAGCVPLAPGCWQTGTPFRPFSVALPGSVFASLLDGAANMRLIQTNNTWVRFGTPTLTIDYDIRGGTVPEPASWAMLIAGFGLVGAVRRRQVAMA